MQRSELDLSRKGLDAAHQRLREALGRAEAVFKAQCPRVGTEVDLQSSRHSGWGCRLRWSPLLGPIRTRGKDEAPTPVKEEEWGFSIRGKPLAAWDIDMCLLAAERIPALWAGVEGNTTFLREKIQEATQQVEAWAAERDPK